MFLTEEKLLKKIAQDRQKGDLKRAVERALEGLDKWPKNFDVAMEAIHGTIDLAEYHRAVSLFRTTLKRHPKHRSLLLDVAREAFSASFNPFLGSFVIEALLRSRNMEEIEGLLRMSPESFLKDLIKRSETRTGNKMEQGDERGRCSADNELLLGLLYMEDKQFEKAVEPLGRSLQSSPEDAQVIGSALVRLERELPNDSGVKFYLGCASMLLEHSDKAEERFFQCLSFGNPDLEKLLEVLESSGDALENRELLIGETLIRSGRTAEGAERITSNLSKAPKEAGDESEKATTIGGWTQSGECQELAFGRLSLLPEETFKDREVAFLYCRVSEWAGNLEKGIEVLSGLVEDDRESIPDIIGLLEGNRELCDADESQKLLCRLYLENGDFSKAAEAARRAVESDPTQAPALIEAIKQNTGRPDGGDPELKALLVELYSKTGDAESAEEIFRSLDTDESIEDEDLFKLSGTIMSHCGVTLNGVASAVEIALRSGNISECLPYVLDLYREDANSHEELARAMRKLAEENDGLWAPLSELIDVLAEQEALSQPMRFLRATAYLFKGEVERGVFEFDQLLFAGPEMREEVAEIYERAANRYGENTTLQLALYQVNLELDRLFEATRHLCRILEIDRGQIRDVMERFAVLVKSEPDNRYIWEEMLKTSLAIKHTNLAKEILNHALSKLPEEQAAAIRIYGAKVSAAEGKWEEALRNAAVSLTSPAANLKEAESVLEIIAKRQPENPEAQYLLGETLLAMGNEEEALEYFKLCLELSPAYREKTRSRLEKLLPVSVGPWSVSIVLGRIAWEENRPEEALHHFAAGQKGPAEILPGLSASLEGLRRNSPDDAGLALLYARNLSLEGRFAEAVSLLEGLAGNDPEADRTVMEILSELLDTAPGNVDANRLLAVIMVNSGDTEKSLGPLIRILSSDDSDASKIDGIVKNFLPYHEKNATFLVPYARLMVRLGKEGEAVDRYRQVLDLDGANWQKILDELKAHSWQADIAGACSLLEADCLIGGNNLDEAFGILKELCADQVSLTDEIVERISGIAEKKPSREHFTFGAHLLAEKGELGRAGEFVRRGCEVLDGDECTDLKIDFAITMRKEGETSRAASLFEEVMSESGDREKALKRIEETTDRWVDLEITSGKKRIESGSSGDVESARLVLLALDHGRPRDALEMLSASRVPGKPRKILLGRIYLAMDRPVQALAALDAFPGGESTPAHKDAQVHYLQGVASERIGDYGRAAASFLRVQATGDEYEDSRRRAEKNYADFLESNIEGKALLLEKRGTLDGASKKERM